MAYCVDVRENGKNIMPELLEVLEYDGEDLEHDLLEANENNPENLSDADRVVFNNLFDAENFLKSYKEHFYTLNTIKDEAQMGIPCLMVYRPHMAMIAMGFKTKTTRKYLKPWDKGRLFYFSDRKHYLLAVIEKIVKIDGLYEYHFIKL